MLPLPPLTLGTSSLGARGTPRQVDELADAIIASRAFAVDTSNAYADGSSELALGEALARAGHPDRLIITKVDARPGESFDGSRVRRSLEESLRRLGVDRMPLLHLHDPYSITVAEALAPGGAAAELVALRDEGLVDAIGIAAGRRDLVLDYVLTDVFDAVLTHNRYTLVDRSGSVILEAAAERRMTVFNAAPFGGGILAGADRRTYGYRQPSAAFLEHVARVRGLAERHGVALAAAALHFSLRSPLVASTVVGASTTARLRELDALVSTDVPEEFFHALESLTPIPESPND